MKGTNPRNKLVPSENRCLMNKLTHNRAEITRFISIGNVEQIITMIVTCDKVCLMWQYEYTQTGNKEYIEFAKNARIRYLSGIVALNVVVRRDNRI